MAIGDVFESVFVHRSATGQNMLNVVHLRVQDLPGPEPTYKEMADDLSALWGGFILNYLAPTTRYEGLKFRRVAPQKSAQVFSTAAAGYGSLVGDALPDHVSMLISLRATNAPPRVRGRIFLPPPSEAENDSNGRPEAAYRSGVETAILSFFTTPVAVTGAGGTCELMPIIYSPNSVPVYWFVDWVIARTNWACQRRRRPNSKPDMSQF